MGRILDEGHYIMFKISVINESVDQQDMDSLVTGTTMVVSVSSSSVASAERTYVVPSGPTPSIFPGGLISSTMSSKIETVNVLCATVDISSRPMDF